MWFLPLLYDFFNPIDSIQDVGLSVSKNYVGCFQDSGARDLPKRAGGGSSLNVEVCLSECKKLKMKFAGLQGMFSCYQKCK